MGAHPVTSPAPRRRPAASAYQPGDEATSHCRLTDSSLWSAQRRFYERRGIGAWRTATVPHHVTNNVALAQTYAQAVLGFVHDTEVTEPLHVVELGAGCG